MNRVSLLVFAACGSLGLLLSLSCQPDKALQPGANRAPIAASGGPYVGAEGALVNFDARTSRDPDGDTLTYAWDFGDGDRGTGGVSGHVYRDNGSYAALLIVVDGHGASDTVSTQVSIANAPPVITLVTIPTTAVTLGMAATIQVLFSDPGVLDSLTAEVDWGDMTSSSITNGIATHVYATEGSYSVTVTVRDNDGAVATTTGASAIIIRDPSVNHAPVARILGPSTAREGALAMFSARASTDPDGDSLRYFWTFVGFPPYGGGSDSIVEQGRSYEDDGVYTIRLTVTDTRGAADTANATLTVVNAPPVVSGISSPLQQAVGVPASAGVTFSDSGYKDTQMITIRWGDGTSDSVAADSLVWVADSIVHTYSKAGSYWVSATVRDDDGGVGSATATSPVLVFDATKHLSIAGYDVFDIGTLGGNAATPLDVNDYGQIVGSSLTAAGSTHAFLWDNGALRDLGTLGNEGSEARRINNAGLIAGSVWSGRSEDCAHPWNAATWRNGSGTILGRGGDLYERYPTTAAAINESGDIVWTACGHENPYAWLWRGDWERLGGLIYPLAMSYGTAINERGQIAGASAAASGNGPRPVAHAFLWENGAMRDLGLLGFAPCRDYPDRNCGYAGATSINESGQVVGFSTAADRRIHAVLWENATIRDLWTAPAGAYEAHVIINDVGQVAGSAGGEGFFWSGGMWHPLGSLGGGSTVVVDMNEAGTVVGTSKTVSGEQHAFVWTQARGMIDLGTGPHGFSAAWVVGISFYGDIVGYTAPCELLPYWDTCSNPTQPRAIMWRHTT